LIGLPFLKSNRVVLELRLDIRPISGFFVNLAKDKGGVSFMKAVL
jgi:hypothetical protein